MFSLEADIKAEGDKKAVYQLKEELLRVASQFNCSCFFTLTDKGGFQESISAQFRPVIEVSAGDIIDLTLTGDEKYELLIQKEKDETSQEQTI